MSLQRKVNSGYKFLKDHYSESLSKIKKVNMNSMLDCVLAQTFNLVYRDAAEQLVKDGHVTSRNLHKFLIENGFEIEFHDEEKEITYEVLTKLWNEALKG